jgi:phosphoglycerate dehydrogenase-like enzyme
MRLLMPYRSGVRVREAIAQISPELEVITMDEGGRLLSEGREVHGPSIHFDVVWLNRDVGGGGLTDQFFALAKKPGTRWLQTSATGLDDPSYGQLLQSGVRLTNSDAQAPAIAQYVLAEVLAEWSGLSGLRTQQERRVWRRTPFREVEGTTWLIVGLGHVGHEVARRARSFGARILGVRRHAVSDEHADSVGTLDDLASFLPRADVVLLSCALTEQTRGLADAKFFGAMKTGAILVNIARGAVAKETDLLAALDAEKLSVAILDVFAQEPLPDAHPLWTHPRVRVSPHNSANGDHTSRRGDELFLANLRRFVENRPLLNEVRAAS